MLLITKEQKKNKKLVKSLHQFWCVIVRCIKLVQAFSAKSRYTCKVGVSLTILVDSLGVVWIEI